MLRGNHLGAAPSRHCHAASFAPRDSATSLAPARSRIHRLRTLEASCRTQPPSRLMQRRRISECPTGVRI
eukprot:13716300-Alexandrium_andersonii.AAC.1